MSLTAALLNSHDTGGAATATRRIHQGLRRIGVDSRMLVGQKDGDETHIIGPESVVRKGYGMARPFIDRAPLQLYGGADGVFSPNWHPDFLDRRVDEFDPDVVHLNWMGAGFMQPGTITSFDRPIVWTFQDMWPMTGGCHYATDCDRYTDACGRCPKLGSSLPWDISRWTMRRKQRAFADADVTVAATSTWLADCANESSLFEECRVEVIPNGLDTELFRPWDRSLARDLFDIDPDETVILFGSVKATSDPRKGFDLLMQALRSLSRQFDDERVRLVVFGASEPADSGISVYPTTYTGFLHDEQSLALLYAAADVMVVPSRYEGFGQTVTEAMACGTPVVAFDATGPVDMIDHEENGYLSPPYDPSGLADGIEWVLADEERREKLGTAAREKAVEQFGLEIVAEQYRELYTQLI